MNECRICANSDVNKSPLLKLFDKQKKHLLKYIQLFTGLLLTQQIGMPEFICETCLQDLERAIKFRERCIKTQNELSRKCHVNSVRRDKKSPDGTGYSILYFPLERKPECQTELINITTEYDNFLTESPVDEESSEVNTQNELNCNYDDNAVTSDQKSADGSSDSVISFTIKGISECPEYDNLLTETTLQEVSSETETQNEINCNSDDNVVRSDQKSADGTSDSAISYTTKGISECPVNEKSLTEVTVQVESSEVVQDKLKNPSKKVKRPVVCEICGKSFNLLGNFREHQIRHSGIKNFDCQFCTFKCYTNKELTRHMRRHTGERPYPCKYCDSRFADLSTRTQHEKRHMDERRFRCDGCDKSFVTSNSLKNHLLVHTRVRSHCCDVCDQWFLRRTHLSTHLRSKAHLQKLANQEQKKIS